MASGTALDVRSSALVQALRLSSDPPPAPTVLERMLRLARPNAAWQALEARLASELWSTLTRESIEADLGVRHVQPKQVAEQALELFRRAATVAVAHDRLEADIDVLRQLATHPSLDGPAETNYVS